MSSPIRTVIQRRIDALHAEIQRLVEVEKAWARKQNPHKNKLWRQVEECQIEVAAWPEQLRKRVHLEGDKP